MAVRTRLLALTLLLLAGGLLAADVTAYAALRAHLLDRTDAVLHATETRLRELDDPRTTRLAALERLAPRALFVALLDGDGELVATTTPTRGEGAGRGWSAAELGALPDGEPRTLAGAAGPDDDYRVLSVSLPDAGLRLDVGDRTEQVRTVVIGLPLADDAAALHTLLLVEVAAGAVVLLGGAGAALVLLRFGLRPLGRIAATARAIERGDHRERIPGGDPRTETGRVVEALNAAFDARSASEQRIRDFVADASHELRTPLTAVHGWADLHLAGGLATWDEVDEAMASIRTESERMHSLVGDLLSLARLDAGQRPAREPVDLADLAREVVGELAPLHTDHPTHRPDGGAAYVDGDRALLHRCLRNLLVNAYRHTPPGTAVRVDVRDVGDAVIAAVTDDGPGLPPGAEERAFDRFWRADSGRGRLPGDGTGLGLAIAREIARAHDGDLTLDSRPGAGLTAHLTVPRPQPTVSEPAADPPATGRDRDGTTGGIGIVRLLSFAVSRPRTTVVAWLLVLLVLVSLARLFGGGYDDDVSLPGTQASAGAALLGDRDDTQGRSSQVVLHVDDGVLAAHRGVLQEALSDLSEVDHVLAVDDPLAGAGPVSADGDTAVATVHLDASARDLGPGLVDDVDEALAPLRADGVEVEYAGALGREAGRDGGGHRTAELIGVAAALLLLLLTFGSVLAAFVPLVTAVLAVGTGLALLTLVAAGATFGTTSPTLATMIGLGTGIDYALFLITRGRQHLIDGASPTEAATAALHGSGHAVLVAAGTVSVALLGLYASGITFVGRLGLAATFTVLTAALAAVTLVPAVLTLTGRRIDRLAVRRPVAEPAPDGRGWYRYAGLVSRRPWPFLLGGVLLLAVLAVPVLDLRLGHIDAGADPAGTTTRAAYDLVADELGPGANGTFTLVARDADDTTLAGLRETIAAEDGVAAVTPFAPTGDPAVRVATVTPTTTPMDQDTRDLHARLAADLARSGTEAYLTGQTAGQIEFGDRVVARLPVIVGVVVAASFLLLLVSFRSVVIAAKAAVLNLLSIGAAYGVVVAVFQWGWGAGLIGLDASVPVESFVPMMMFAIVFGLSMDYEVFLLSRVREAWLRTGDTTASVAEGLASTARVISCAALVMVSVFLAFATDDDVVIKMLAIGLAVSVAVDATVVRLVLVPAAMAVLGRANWWAPRWLDRLLPGRSAAELAEQQRLGQHDALELREV
ncbi:MMPL family transporter [Nocardioides sp.]|uniref:MMPL family transporter n=1 Tax=Nocardioides sp. TaxID=35761 RepID=UPI002ED9C04F